MSRLSYARTDEARERRNARARERYANDPEYRERILGYTNAWAARNVEKRRAAYVRNREKILGAIEANPRRFMVALIQNSKRNAKGRPYGLTVDYLMEMLASQDGRCALSGVQMTFHTLKGRVPTNVSIDRLDNNIGYVEGNVRLVCTWANLARNMWSGEVFREMCVKVTQWHA